MKKKTGISPKTAEGTATSPKRKEEHPPSKPSNSQSCERGGLRRGRATERDEKERVGDGGGNTCVFTCTRSLRSLLALTL